MVQPMDLRHWNVPGSIFLIVVSIMIAVLDEKASAEADILGGGMENDEDPLQHEEEDGDNEK